MFAQKFGVAGPDLFFKFTKSGFRGRLSLIDSALRQLPTLDHLVNASANKNETIAIQEHDAHAGTVGKIGVAK
jgi:hypothetical protein